MFNWLKAIVLASLLVTGMFAVVVGLLLVLNALFSVLGIGALPIAILIVAVLAIAWQIKDEL